MKKRNLCVFLVIVLCCLCGCRKAAVAKPGGDGDPGEAVSSLEPVEEKTSDSSEPTTAGPTTAGPTTAGPTTAGPTTEAPTAAPAATEPAPMTETVFDYEFKEGTVYFRYEPLDKTADGDIYAACVNSCAELDRTFRQNDVSASAAIRDRETYTDAKIELAVVDGDSGRAVVFLRFLPMPEPEFIGMHPDYYFILRTSDHGRTWERSVNALCFYTLYAQSLYFDSNLYVSGYSETNGGSNLCSRDGMDSCTLTRRLQGVPESYITGIRADATGEHIIYSVETTYNGYFIHDGTENHYDVTCDLNMNMISFDEVD